MKSTNETFFENYICPVLTTISILINGKYSSQTAPDEHKIKVSMEEDINVFLLEIELKEQEGMEFVHDLKNNNLTKYIPVLMETKLKTQFFWDKYNLQKLNGNLEKPGKEYLWLLIKINAKNGY